MWWIILLFAVGLFLIIKGGDLFVDAAVWIAEVTGIPKFIIGATIVSPVSYTHQMCIRDRLMKRRIIPVPKNRRTLLGCWRRSAGSWA